jgi:hypothetical protein
MGFTCGFLLPPSDYISLKGNAVLHSDIVRYDREYISCHIGEISIL